MFPGEHFVALLGIARRTYSLMDWRSKGKTHCVAQLIPMILSGTAPLYLLSTMYVVAGALLGAPAGVEFIAATEAAKQVCACPQPSCKADCL